MGHAVLRPMRVAATGTNNTAWLPLCRTMSKASIFVDRAGGTWEVEATYDDVQDTSITPTAVAHSSLATVIADAVGYYGIDASDPFPAAVRLKNTATGDAIITIIQHP